MTAIIFIVCEPKDDFDSNSLTSNMKTLLAIALLVGAAPVILAQPHEHLDPGQPVQPASRTSSSQYAGYQERDIKSLSAQQMEDLQAGRGMSLALAAELNGYPGPAHVLELSAQLGLTQDQQEITTALMEQMKADAKRLGKDAIESERQLDRLFRNREASEASLALAVERTGLTQATLRASHLKYHLRMVKLLTPQQIARYQELRGYVASAPPSQSTRQIDTASRPRDRISWCAAARRSRPLRPNQADQRPKTLKNSGHSPEGCFRLNAPYPS